MNHHPNQKEWNGFIQDLEKFFNRRGQFTPTLSGFSSDPTTSLVRWGKTGSLVSMSFSNAALGTSDAVNFQITGLSADLQITSGVALEVPITGLVDNNVTSWGSVYISGSVITFNFEGSDGGWTASGSKGFDISGAQDMLIVYDRHATFNA